jgi:DNA polymerase I-like protein with 3'-5' exonuclease and polymerase domains
MTEKRARNTGLVKTTLGRRRRYDRNNPRERFYSAMNSVLQGSAADVAKLKIKRLYAERKRFGLTLRSCVHDEANGTVPEVVPELAKFMNEQEIDLNVPVLWKTGFGPNWEDAH